MPYLPTLNGSQPFCQNCARWAVQNSIPSFWARPPAGIARCHPSFRLTQTDGKSALTAYFSISEHQKNLHKIQKTSTSKGSILFGKKGYTRTTAATTASNHGRRHDQNHGQNDGHSHGHSHSRKRDGNVQSGVGDSGMVQSSVNASVFLLSFTAHPTKQGMRGFLGKPHQFVYTISH